MAKDNIALPAEVTDAYVWETSPKPGPRLLRHAPMAENADWKSRPVTTSPNNKTINLIWMRLKT